MNENDIEAVLRATLSERSRQAPDGGQLAERILHQFASQPAGERPTRSRRWQSWTLPLIAAGSVAAVVAAVLGVSQIHHDAGRGAPIAPGSRTVQQPVTSPPPRTPSTPASTPSRSAATPEPTTSAVGGAADGVGLTHFQAIDVTFVGTRGWAWGTADCINDPGTVCAAMVRTVDDGASWHSMRGPQSNAPLAGCASPCVRSVRFASDQVGYAFGSDSFFMTIDGGRSWQRQAGGAEALETLDGNVIRIVVATAGCSPPGCAYTAHTASIGSSNWRATGLRASSPGTSVGVALTRSGSHAYLLVLGHTAGGGSAAESTLYSSADDAASWTTRGEPCPQTGGGTAGREVDSTALSSASDGSVTVLCTPRGGTTSFTSTSTDGGLSFHAGRAFPSGSAMRLGAASSSVLLAATDTTNRSADAGRTWQPVAAPNPGAVRWIGFESDQVGRALSQGGGVIFTTRDAGLTWSPFSFD
jgi:hypothetical protein